MGAPGIIVWMHTLIRGMSFWPEGGLCNRLGQGLVAICVLGGAHAAGLAQSNPARSTPTSTLLAESAQAQATALTPQLLHQLLIAEWQISSGQPGQGFQLLLEAGRRTQDERLFERAVEVAMQAGAGESALQAARAWRAAMPKSKAAARQHVSTLAAMGRIDDLAEPFRAQLNAAEPQERAELILGLPELLSRNPDKATTLATAKTLLKPELEGSGIAAAQRAAAWAVVASQEGLLQLSKGESSGSRDWAATVEALGNGFKADPSSHVVADMATRLVEQTPALDGLVERYIARPDSRAGIAANYGRALVQAARYAKGKSILLQTVERHPQAESAWLLLSALHAQAQEWSLAESAAKRYLSLVEIKDGETQSAARAEAIATGMRQAHLTLAQVAESRKDYVAALSWLEKVGDGQEVAAVVLRRASVMAQQGNLEGARALIRRQPTRDDDDKKRLLIAEASLLRDQKAHAQAYAVLDEAAKRFGTDPDLQYDQAMVAEKLGKLDLMETHLRAVIAAKPTDSNAYNALGYAWAEKRMRLPEAKAMIEKALSLSPGDPYITDSLGWVVFRMGDLPGALKHLQTAFDAKPDAEIGAHLGEVLWASGKQDDAKSMWRRAWQLNPSNETLLETIKRFGVKLP